MRVRHLFAAPIVLTAALAHADKLPKAKKGQPVFAESGTCYTLGRKEVRCPPNVVLPDFGASVPSGDGKIIFDDFTFGCELEESFSCPQGATCNPPEPRSVACPDELLPKLAKKVK